MWTLHCIKCLCKARARCIKWLLLSWSCRTVHILWDKKNGFTLSVCPLSIAHPFTPGILYENNGLSLNTCFSSPPLHYDCIHVKCNWTWNCIKLTVGEIWEGSGCYSFRPSSRSIQVLYICKSSLIFSIFYFLFCIFANVGETNEYKAFAIVIYCTILHQCLSFLLISCSNSLRAFLQNLERESCRSTGIATHGQPERNDDFDCTLCLKLLFEPVTTPCGHSFCRSCLFQSMDCGWYCLLLIIFSVEINILYIMLMLILVLIC